MSDRTMSTGAESPLEGAGTRPAPIRAVPLRHPWRWVGAGILILAAAMLVHTLVFSSTEQPKQTGSRFIWPIVNDYLFSPLVLKGAVLTIELTIISMVAGVILGVILAVMRLSKSRLISGTAWVYVWFFRGTPVLIQIFFWFFISSLYPHITLGIPFGPSFASINMNAVLTAFWAGALALTLNEGAYMSEIVRAGIISVDEGQAEAAESIGMSRAQALRLIVLPQAMRLIIPPTGNETISMLKTTSLVSVISVGELTHVAQDIAAQNYRQIQLFMVVAFWYLLMTTVLSIGQYYLERHYARGSTRELPATPWQRVREGILHIRPRGPAPTASITAAEPVGIVAHPDGEDHR